LSAPHPPLWARWLLSLLGFAVLILLVWIAARGGGGGSSLPERSAEVEANREGQVVIAEDQAPHTAPLRSGTSARVALEFAISADVRNRIRHGELTGAFQSVRCAVGPTRAGRRAYSCTGRVAGVTYPFLGVVNERARELTWCKRDPPPVSNAPLAVPISRRCRA